MFLKIKYLLGKSQKKTKFQQMSLHSNEWHIIDILFIEYFLSLLTCEMETDFMFQMLMTSFRFSCELWIMISWHFISLSMFCLDMCLYFVLSLYSISIYENHWIKYISINIYLSIFFVLLLQKRMIWDMTICEVWFRQDT